MTGLANGAPSHVDLFDHKPKVAVGVVKGKLDNTELVFEKLDRTGWEGHAHDFFAPCGWGGK